MSGATDDDETKEEILRLLLELEQSAARNDDADLVRQIHALWMQVYELETY